MYASLYADMCETITGRRCDVRPFYPERGVGLCAGVVVRPFATADELTNDVYMRYIVYPTRQLSRPINLRDSPYTTELNGANQLLVWFPNRILGYDGFLVSVGGLVQLSK